MIYSSIFYTFWKINIKVFVNIIFLGQEWKKWANFKAFSMVKNKCFGAGRQCFCWKLLNTLANFFSEFRDKVYCSKQTIFRTKITKSVQIHSFSTFFIFLMKIKFLSHFSFTILLVFAMSNVFYPRFGKLFGLEEVVIFSLNVNVFVETLWRFRSAIFRKKSRRSAISLQKIRLCTPYFRCQMILVDP